MNLQVQQSLLLVDYYFRNLKKPQINENDRFSSFFQLLNGDESIFSGNTTIIGEKQIRNRLQRFEDYVQSDGDVALDCDDEYAMLLHANDINIFYDKIRFILSSLNANINYVQTFENCATEDIVQTSWFVKNYISYCAKSFGETFNQCVFAKRMAMFFILTEDELRTSGILTAGFCELPLRKFLFAICRKRDYNLADARLSKFGKIEKISSPKDFCIRTARTMFLFHNRVLNKKPKQKPFDPDEYMLDYDDPIRGQYHKLNENELDELHEPLYAKYSVSPSWFCDVPISSLYFDVSTIHYLSRAGVKTLDQLLCKTPYEIEHMFNIKKLRLDDIFCGLERKFGKQNNVIAPKTKEQSKTSIYLRSLHTITKRNALDYMRSFATNNAAAPQAFGDNIQSILTNMLTTLGNELCAYLASNHEYALSLSSLLTDWTEAGNTQASFVQEFSKLPLSVLNKNAWQLCKLCDDIHLTNLCNLGVLRSNRAEKMKVQDMACLSKEILTRKESADLTFFLRWAQGGVNQIAKRMINALFAKYPARLEIMRDLASGLSFDETAIKNTVKPYNMTIACRQIMRRVQQENVCQELLRATSIFNYNENFLSKEDFFATISIDDVNVLFYLLKENVVGNWHYNEEEQAFVQTENL